MSREFYEQKTRTLLGLGIYYLDDNDNRIKLINVDFITEQSSNALCVISCFELLRKQGDVKFMLNSFNSFNSLNYYFNFEIVKFFKTLRKIIIINYKL